MTTVAAYLSLIRTDGTFVNVGLPEEPASVNLMSVIGGRKTLAGSVIGGVRETQQVLDSDVRYRFVIDTATI